MPPKKAAAAAAADATKKAAAATAPAHGSYIGMSRLLAPPPGRAASALVAPWSRAHADPFAQTWSKMPSST